MPNTDSIVSGLRRAIGDEKTKDISVVNEVMAVTTGEIFGTYYTLNMPVVSGEDVHLRVGRWYYSKVSSEAAANGIRGFTFNVPSGAFTIPNGAIGPGSGVQVLGSYTHRLEQEYEYRDSELYEYVRDGLELFQDMYDFNLDGTGIGTGYAISPDPTNFQSIVIMLSAKYLVKKDREDHGFVDSIYIRENDIAIDTTKGLKTQTDSSKDLLIHLQSIANRLHIRDNALAGELIDTYSSYIDTDVVGLEYEQNEQDGNLGLGLGNE